MSAVLTKNQFPYKLQETQHTRYVRGYCGIGGKTLGSTTPPLALRETLEISTAGRKSGRFILNSGVVTNGLNTTCSLTSFLYGASNMASTSSQSSSAMIARAARF